MWRGRLWCTARLTACLQLVECELVVERAQDLAGKRAVDAQLEQLAEKQGLVVERVGHLFGRRHEARRLVHADAVLGVERAAPEDDRRDMSLAGGAQAEHEPACALFQSGLVGVPDHRRIEERGRFQRVFLGEVRADQHPAILGERLVGEQVFLELIKPVQKEVAGFLMAAVKLAHHVVEQGIDFRLPRAT